jgi:hypothetical protein
MFFFFHFSSSLRQSLCSEYHIRVLYATSLCGLLSGAVLFMCQLQHNRNQNYQPRTNTSSHHSSGLLSVSVDCSVSILTRLQAERQRNQGSIPCRGNKILFPHSVQKGSFAYQFPYLMGTRALFSLLKRMWLAADQSPPS